MTSTSRPVQGLRIRTTRAKKAVLVGVRYDDLDKRNTGSKTKYTLHSTHHDVLSLHKLLTGSSYLSPKNLIRIDVPFKETLGYRREDIKVLMDHDESDDDPQGHIYPSKANVVCGISTSAVEQYY